MHSYGRPPLALATLALLAAAVTGCTGDGGGTTAARTGRDPGPTTTADPRRPALPQDEGGPLDGLPACDPPPAATASAADVDGLLLPDDAVVTSVDEGDPLVTVQGYIPQTPIVVRQFLQEARGLELYEIEDEIFEAEALYGQGEHRVYVKAQAACAEGSTLLVVIGPAGDTELPSPGGFSG